MTTIEQAWRNWAGPALLDEGGPLLEVLLAVMAGAHKQSHDVLTGPPLVAAFDGRFGPAWTQQWRAGTGRPGTPAALIDAVRSTLVGEGRVELVERDGGDWRAVRVQVYASEVVDLAATTAAALTAVPDGLLLSVQVLSGATDAHMEAVHGPTDADFLAAFPTDADARDHLPE